MSIRALDRYKCFPLDPLDCDITNQPFKFG